MSSREVQKVQKASPQVVVCSTIFDLFVKELKHSEESLRRWSSSKDAKEKAFLEKIVRCSAVTLNDLRREVKPLLDGKEGGSCNPGDPPSLPDGNGDDDDQYDGSSGSNNSGGNYSPGSGPYGTPFVASTHSPTRKSPPKTVNSRPGSKPHGKQSQDAWMMDDGLSDNNSLLSVIDYGYWDDMDENY